MPLASRRRGAGGSAKGQDSASPGSCLSSWRYRAGAVPEKVWFFFFFNGYQVNTLLRLMPPEAGRGGRQWGPSGAQGSEPRRAGLSQAAPRTLRIWLEGLREEERVANW